MIEHSRRGFLTGLGAILCAPAIVRVASLMPLSVLKLTFDPPWAHSDDLFDAIKYSFDSLRLDPGGLNYITATEICTLEQQALKRYAKLFDRVLNPPIIANWPLGPLAIPSRD